MAGTDLRHYVRVYDGDLDPLACARMIDSFHAQARFQTVNGRTARPGLADSGWTELNLTRLADAALLTMLRARVDAALARYNVEIGLPIPIPNSPKLADYILKRYRPGHDEQFQLHFDAVHDVANRYFVLLWYLNDVAVGGATEFPGLQLTVEARAGRLLVFPPYWMYQHAGRAPVSGDKYILGTYLLF